MWPWIGIVVNILTSRENDGTIVLVSGAKLRDEYKSRGFNPMRVKPLWKPRGHTGTALVEFVKKWFGFNNALEFEKAYALEHRGKKDWFVNTQQKSSLYAWFS